MQLHRLDFLSQPVQDPCYQEEGNSYKRQVRHRLACLGKSLARCSVLGCRRSLVVWLQGPCPCRDIVRVNGFQIFGWRSVWCCSARLARARSRSDVSSTGIARTRLYRSARVARIAWITWIARTAWIIRGSWVIRGIRFIWLIWLIWFIRPIRFLRFLRFLRFFRFVWFRHQTCIDAQIFLFLLQLDPLGPAVLVRI